MSLHPKCWGVHSHSSTHFIQPSKLEKMLYYDFSSFKIFNAFKVFITFICGGEVEAMYACEGIMGSLSSTMWILETNLSGFTASTFTNRSILKVFCFCLLIGWMFLVLFCFLFLFLTRSHSAA